MEFIKSELKEIKGDLKEMKSTLVENTIRLAEYNKDLGIHIQASKDLHDRVVPIEQHVIFIRKLGKLIVWIVGILASMATFLGVLFGLRPNETALSQKSQAPLIDGFSAPPRNNIQSSGSVSKTHVLPTNVDKHVDVDLGKGV